MRLWASATMLLPQYYSTATSIHHPTFVVTLHLVRSCRAYSMTRALSSPSKETTKHRIAHLSPATLLFLHAELSATPSRCGLLSIAIFGARYQLHSANVPFRRPTTSQNANGLHGLGHSCGLSNIPAGTRLPAKLTPQSFVPLQREESQGLRRVRPS